MNLKCCKSWILGNDFFFNKAVIDFSERVLNTVRIMGNKKVILKRVNSRDTEARVNAVSYTHLDVYKRQPMMYPCGSRR